MWKFDGTNLEAPAKYFNGYIFGDLKEGNPRISPNFKANEFACACCKIYKVNIKLLEGLELARSLCKIPLIIASTTLASNINPTGSGYRCVKQNSKVGGVNDSQHTLGNAADVAPSKDRSIDQLYKILESIPVFNNGGIGKYKNFIHVDTGRKRRWSGN